MRKPKAITPGNYLGLTVNPAYVILRNKIQPLDFFCTQGTGFIGWTIRKITENLSPDRECEFNHAGLLPDGTACTLEALWHVESKNLFEHYEGCKILIGRFNNLTLKSSKLALSKIVEHIDQPYPKRRLFFHLLNLAHHIHWINAVVCSELVAKMLFYSGARGHKWWGVTPDIIADEIQHSLNENRIGPKYTIVFEGHLPWLIYKYCIKCKQIYLTPIVDKFCYHCRKNYVDYNAIPHKDLREKVKDYNNLKIKYISELQGEK